MKTKKRITKVHRQALEGLAKEAASCIKLEKFGSSDPRFGLMVFSKEDKVRIDDLSVGIKKANDGDPYGLYNFHNFTNTIYAHPNIFKKFGFVIKKTPVEGINENYRNIFYGDVILAEGGNRG